MFRHPAPAPPAPLAAGSAHRPPPPPDRRPRQRIPRAPPARASLPGCAPRSPAPLPAAEPGSAAALPAPAGPRRLGIDAQDLAPRLHQRVESRHGEIRRPHEDQPHGRLPGHARARTAPSPASALSSARRTSPLHRARWSMNSRPLRWSISCWAQIAQRSPNSCFVHLPVEPQPAQPHPLRPGHVLIDLGDREAPLLAGLRLLRRPRAISGLISTMGWRRIVLVAAVHDEDLPHHPELGSRQPDPRRLVHRRQHVRRQRADLVVHRLDAVRRPCAAADRGGSGWVGSSWPRNRRCRLP